MIKNVPDSELWKDSVTYSDAETTAAALGLDISTHEWTRHCDPENTNKVRHYHSHHNSVIKHRWEVPAWETNLMRHGAKVF